LTIQDKPNSSPTTEDIKLVSSRFNSNSRLYKLNHGVLKAGSNASNLSWYL
jgi:hypothetical protein